MNIKDIIAVSGVPGLSKLIATRDNGLVLQHLDTGRSKFYSVRKHQFTPLETVAIYTMMDTVELREVLTNMLAQKDENPVVAHNGDASEIYDYFEKILPDYDKERVFLSDMKKIIKWYNILDEKGLLTAPSDEEE